MIVPLLRIWSYGSRIRAARNITRHPYFPVVPDPPEGPRPSMGELPLHARDHRTSPIGLRAAACIEPPAQAVHQLGILQPHRGL